MTVHICNRLISTHMRLHMCVFYVLSQEGLPHALKPPPFMLSSLSLFLLRSTVNFTLPKSNDLFSIIILN